MGNALRLVVSGDIKRQLTRAAVKIPVVLASVARDMAPELVTAAQYSARRLHIVTIDSSGKRVKKKRLAAEAGGGSVREAIARSVSYRVTGMSVTVFVDGKRMPRGKDRLPIVTAKKDWRHPVFGNRESWAEQRGRSGWFSRAVRAEAKRTSKDRIAKAIEKVLAA